MMHHTHWTRSVTMAICAAALLCSFITGCSSNQGFLGYQHQLLFPENVNTVAVDILTNQTFYRGVEFDVTEALTKEIELRTPYKIVRKSQADSLIQGTVLSVDQPILNRTFSGGMPQEVQVTITMSYEWKDLRTGQVIRKLDRIRGTGEQIPTQPYNEPFAHAQHDAASELARDIVSSMGSDW